MPQANAQSQNEMDRRWRIAKAVGRWSRLRRDFDQDPDPRPMFRSIVERMPLCDEEPRDTDARRLIVFRAISDWMGALERRKGLPFDLSRFELEMNHSALLWWLFHGNEILPHPPPLRMSRPDHHMALTGKVQAFEVWRREGVVDACVDQATTGWKYVEGDEDSGRFVFDQRHWGRWEFIRKTETRTTTRGHKYEHTFWEGTRIS